MMIEIKTKEEKDEMIRALNLLDRYPIPVTADLSDIKAKLESF